MRNLRCATLAILAAACADPKDPTPVPPAEPTPDTPDTPGAFALISAAVRVPDATDVWLVRQLDVVTSEPSTLTATLLDPTGRERTIAFHAVAAAHHVALAGLRADTAYTVRVTVTSASGAALSTAPLPFESGPAPSPLPELERVVSGAAGVVEPGVTLTMASSDGTGFVIVAYDDAWEPVWAFDPPADWDAQVPTGHGTLFGVEGASVVELDLLGQDVRRYGSRAALPLGFGRLHHDAVPKSDGSFFALSAAPVELASYPSNYERSVFGPAVIQDNPIYHVAADGTELARFSLAELLDTQRISFSSLEVAGSGEVDWCHANKLFVDEASGGLLVSVRHQDAVVMLDETTGALRWIFGTPEGWRPPWRALLLEPIGAPFDWPTHQHGASLLPGGKLLLFDNGNYGRTTPYSDDVGEESFSRVAQFTVDEAARTVSLDWEWRDTATGLLFSEALGHATALPVTGHILANFSFLKEEAGVVNADVGLGFNSTRIIEFDPESGATISDVRFFSQAADAQAGWLLDRAYRVSDLYGDTATDSGWRVSQQGIGAR